MNFSPKNILPFEPVFVCVLIFSLLVFKSKKTMSFCILQRNKLEKLIVRLIIYDYDDAGDVHRRSSSPVARVRGAVMVAAVTVELTACCSVPTATSFAPFDSSFSFLTMSNSFKSSILNSIRVGFRRFIVAQRFGRHKCR